MRSKKWNDNTISVAVKNATSIRQVIIELGLVPAGGNYQQVQHAIQRLNLNIDHFNGKGWNKGKSGRYLPRRTLKDILQLDTDFQSYKLKKRLFIEKIFTQECSLCGWNKMATDGRIPLELDHINGNRRDNRIENLRILCPNCHSLQPTHRGKNKKKVLG